MAGDALDLEPFSSSLAIRWLSDQPEDRHRRVVGTLVSADLSGFTALSEELATEGRVGAERLTELVNACFSRLISLFAASGGDVLKFGGDALLVWFEGDGHAERAATAAVACQRAIAEPDLAGAGLRMSVGAHTGVFDMFLVGRRDWRELVVAGPPVTRTVRMESEAQAGHVLVSEELGAALPSAWLGARQGSGHVLALDAVPPRADPQTPAGPARRSAADTVTEALLPPRLRDQVRSLTELGGEHRRATAVFLELIDTDALVEADPDEAVSLIDAVVRSAQDASERFGALLLYSDVTPNGIKLLSTAGAPVSTGEDEEAALRFAVEMVLSDRPVTLRGGLACGRLFAGFLGSRDRRTYTVMGDTANLAARLMGRSEPGRVLAGADVLARSRADFESTELAPFLVKGRTQPVVAHTVGRPTGSRREQTRRRLPLVGRDVELAELDAAIAAAAGGRGRVVELVGDAGIGKTRLIEAVADDIRVATRLFTECQPYDSLSPYASIRPLIRQALSIPSTASAADAGRLIEAVAAEAAPETVPLLPLLSGVLQAEVAPTAEAAAVAPEFRQVRMHETLAELLTRVLTSPTMMVVEDVYFIDDASLLLLRHLAATVAERPWMLIVTRRPAGPGLVVGDVPGTLIKVSPLPSQSLDHLASLVVAGGEGPTLDLRALSDRSGGNPLFLLQLIDAVDRSDDAQELPESIERLIATQIDQLTPRDRLVLRLCAVIGRVFHTDVLDALLQHESLPPAGDDWGRFGTLLESEGVGAFRFSHPLFRDIAYEGLPFARRKRMHAAVASLLEAGVGGEPDVGLLSEHCWLAGDAERTWRYSTEAGRAAWAANATTEASLALRRALGVRRRLRGLDRSEIAEVAELAGDVSERTARYDEAVDLYRMARRYAPETGPHPARLMRKLGEVWERRGAYRQALSWYARAQDRLGEATTEELVALADVELARAGVMYRQGRHRELRRHASRAHDLAIRAGDRYAEARALLLLQLADSHTGRGGTTNGLAALALFDALGEVHQQGKTLNNLGIEHYYRGRWGEAVKCYEQASERFHRAGDGVESAIADNNLGELLTEQGHLEAAAERLERARQGFEARRYPFGAAVARSNQARVAARTGETERALQLLDDAVTALDSLGSAAFRAEAVLRRAETLILAGRPDEAGAVLDELEQAEADEMFESTTAAIARFRGWVTWQQGDREGAKRWFRAGLARAQQADSDWDAALAHRALADVAAIEGDPAEIALRDAARQVFDRAGVVVVPAVPLTG